MKIYFKNILTGTKKLKISFIQYIQIYINKGVKELYRGFVTLIWDKLTSRLANVIIVM